MSLVNRLFAQLEKRVETSGGVVVKTLGDGMVCQFRDAESALNAAMQLQAAAARMPAEDDAKLEIRVGTTWGPVVTKDGDVFGDTVNVCARLQALANPQQVLTTRELVEALPAKSRRRCRELYPTKIRGRAGEVIVYEIFWREDPDVTQMSLHEAPRSGTWVLKLSYDGGSVMVEPGAMVRLGRDKANDVVVSSTLASRVHARVVGRDGNYFLVDQSSNGTFLAVDGGKPASNHGAHVCATASSGAAPSPTHNIWGLAGAE